MMQILSNLNTYFRFLAEDKLHEPEFQHTCPYGYLESDDLFGSDILLKIF
jgi:hypothetical protein